MTLSSMTLSRLRSTFAAAAFALLLPIAGHAQYAPRPGYPPPGYAPQGYPPPAQRPSFVLGTAHVDGPTDHDDIKVDRYAGRFHFVLLKVRYAPIQFDHVLIHYGDGDSEPLPVNQYIGPGGTSRWIALPGGERRIRSLELWYQRADNHDRNRPEVELYGAQ
jgi:hypothetical protein